MVLPDPGEAEANFADLRRHFFKSFLSSFSCVFRTRHLKDQNASLLAGRHHRFNAAENLRSTKGNTFIGVPPEATNTKRTLAGAHRAARLDVRLEDGD